MSTFRGATAVVRFGLGTSEVPLTVISTLMDPPLLLSELMHWANCHLCNLVHESCGNMANLTYFWRK